MEKETLNHPPIPNPNPGTPPPASAPSAFGDPRSVPCALLRGGALHRRVQSELPFGIQDDFHLICGEPAASGNSDEIGSDGNLIFTYMDVEKIPSESGSGSDGTGSDVSLMVKSRGEGVSGEVMEAKKAMPSDKLAEIAAMDPKRAKRILANRQSAARSKERKAHYISELERTVQILQTEATTLSAQLTVLQKVTSELTTENAHLRSRLEAMEQEAQLHDALNDALKQEVGGLKIATGETESPVGTYGWEFLNMPYSSLFLASQQQPGNHQAIQLHPQFQQSKPNLTSQQFLSHHLALSDGMQQDSHGKLEGIDIRKGSQMAKSESSSISASESRNTF